MACYWRAELSRARTLKPASTALLIAGLYRIAEEGRTALGYPCR